LLLDGLATRYHLLPSEVIQRADTLDVLVSETAQAWQRRQRELAEAKAHGRAPAAPRLSQDEMQAMLSRVRKKQ
jgi:hypothetical protein